MLGRIAHWAVIVCEVWGLLLVAVVVLFVALAAYASAHNRRYASRP